MNVVLLLFPHLIFSENISERLFISNTKNFTGDWEFSFDAKPYRGGIQLLSGSKKNNGGAYFVKRLSTYEWSAEITFEFGESTNPEKSFGIWLTKNYREDPYVFGGPLLFYGAALLSNYNGTHIFSELRFNDKTKPFGPMSFFPETEIPINNLSLKIRMEYFNQTLNITFHSGGKSYPGFFRKVPFDIRKSYLSVTASNFKDPAPLQVVSAHFRPDPNYDFSEPTIKYLNFLDNNNKNRTKSTKQNHSYSQNAKVNDVLDEITMFGIFVEELSTKKELRSVIDTTIIPYAESWQRRSITMMQNTSLLRKVLVEDLKEATFGFDLMKKDIKKQMKLLRAGLHDIEGELYYGISGNDVASLLANGQKNSVSKISQILSILGFLEILGLALFVGWKIVVEYIRTH